LFLVFKWFQLFIIPSSHRQPERHQPGSPGPPMGPDLLLRPRPAGLRPACLGWQEGEHPRRPERAAQARQGESLDSSFYIRYGNS